MPGYHVIILRLTENGRANHPDGAEMRIRIITDKLKDQLVAGIPPAEVFAPGFMFESWVQEEGIHSFDTELEAWKTVYSWRDDLKAKGIMADFFESGGYSIYAFRMDESVWEKPKFKNANPGHGANTTNVLCYYVGMTIKGANERYETHRDEDHFASTIWGREYFLEPFDKAYASEMLEKYQEMKELPSPERGNYG